MAQLNVWLRQPESEYLEFIASAFADVDHLVGRRPAPRHKDEQVHNVAKAVCSMLNTEGGTIVIGVAELDQYTQEELDGPYGYPPKVGSRSVIGIAAEYTKPSGWENYRLALRRQLQNTIEGELDGWVDLQHVTTPENRELCVIRLRRPPDYYYVKGPRRGMGDTFYVRTGSETRPLVGRATDTFREAHPRSLAE